MRHRRRHAVWLGGSSVFTLSLAVLCGGCAREGVRPASTATGVSLAVSPVTLAVAGRANENVALAASGRVVVATWSAAPDLNSEDVYAAVSDDEGATFGPPVRVNAQTGDAKANGEQPPRAVIVSTSRGEHIDVFWMTARAGSTAFAAARSVDHGATFSRLRVPANVNAQGNRGWAMFLPRSSAQIDAIWLDHRRLARAPGSSRVTGARGHSAHASGAGMDTVAMAQLSDLYFASFAAPDHPGAMTEAVGARALTSGVCYCCKTAVAHGPDGAVYLAWRHVYPGDMRDIAFTSSRDAGRTFAEPVRVHEDRWSVKGCPDDGPAMATDTSGRVHLVWPTMAMRNESPTRTILYSTSVDGRTFSEPVAVPSHGQAHHPQIVATDGGSIIVAWDEASGDRRTVAVATATIESSGRTGFVRGPDLDDSGLYPALAHVGDRVLLAWSSKAPDSKPVIRLQQLQPVD